MRKYQGDACVAPTNVNHYLHVPVLVVCLVLASGSLMAQRTAESRNMVLVGHNDLNGLGDGGEGLALQQLPDGRRILYLAH
jgi:hypothetical protein